MVVQPDGISGDLYLFFDKHDVDGISTSNILSYYLSVTDLGEFLRTIGAQDKSTVSSYPAAPGWVTIHIRKPWPVAEPGLYAIVLQDKAAEASMKSVLSQKLGGEITIRCID